MASSRGLSGLATTTGTLSFLWSSCGSITLNPASETEGNIIRPTPLERFTNDITVFVPSVPSICIRSRRTRSIELQVTTTPTTRQYLSALEKDPSSIAKTFKDDFLSLCEVNLAYLQSLQIEDREYSRGWD